MQECLLNIKDKNGKTISSYRSTIEEEYQKKTPIGYTRELIKAEHKKIDGIKSVTLNILNPIILDDKYIPPVKPLVKLKKTIKLHKYKKRKR